MSLKHITLIIVTITLTGCRSIQEKKALNTIDEQIVVIDSLLDVYRQLPLDSLNLVYINKLKANYELVKSVMGHTPSLTIQDMTILSTFADYVKGLIEFVPLAEKTVELLFFCKKQLEHLRHDIENNLIPADSIKIYVEHELNSYTIMRPDIDKVMWLKTMSGFYRDIEIKADSIIESNFRKKD